jgi:hypothetical protein
VFDDSSSGATSQSADPTGSSPFHSKPKETPMNVKTQIKAGHGDDTIIWGS